MSRTLTLTLLTAVLLLSQPVLAADQREARSISVSGIATVNVVPDQVAISLNVASVNPDLRQAKADNDARVQKVLALMKEFKIDPRDVQTTQVNLAPHWKQKKDGEPEFAGYGATNSIRVLLKDLSRYDELVARAIEVGTVTLGGISFEYSDTKTKRAEARKMALQAARDKARMMAAEFDQKIGQPLKIEDLVPGTDAYGSSVFGNQQAQSVYYGDTTADVTTLAPGEIEITARVYVQFELVD